MSFFDRGNTTYVDATLGWKFPTWGSLKALFSKYMPQWPAGARRIKPKSSATLRARSYSSPTRHRSSATRSAG